MTAEVDRPAVGILPSAPAPEVAPDNRLARAREEIGNYSISQRLTLPDGCPAYLVTKLATLHTYAVKKENGIVSCTCRDFAYRGGACKHMHMVGLSRPGKKAAAGRRTGKAAGPAAKQSLEELELGQ